MDLYFVRHADASEAGERPLSKKGREQAQAVGAWLKKMHVAPDAVLCSPLLRARETAEIIGGLIGVAPSAETLLSSGTELDDIADLLQDFDREDTVMLVGHEPDFSRAIAALIGGGKVEMEKATVVWVTCKHVRQGGGVLRWLVPQAQML